MPTELLPEAERLDPAPSTITLSTGQEVDILRLKTRQLLRLLKIVTHGAGPAIVRLISTLQELNEDNSDDLATQLVTVVLLAIPDAEQETLEFFASILQPVGLVDKPVKDLTKTEVEHNQALWNRMNTTLSNPDVLDTIEIIYAIFQKEGPEIASLGKRIAQMLKLAGMTGQDKVVPPEPAPTAQDLVEMERAAALAASGPASPARPSAVPSPSPTTSSPPSTDGQTSRSGTSPSGGSAKSPTP